MERSIHSGTRTEGIAGLLWDLVAIHSVNPSFPNGGGESDLASWLVSYCRSLGLAVETQEVFPGRPNVLARLPASSSRGVLLFEAHLDTVSFGTQAMESPDIRGGRLYGRGACDTKGSLAAMLVALERLTKRTDELAADVLLLGSVDEESSGAGANHYVANGGHADGAVVGEPTGLQIVVAHKGCVRFRVTAKGRAAHSSKPDQGSNAIYILSDVIQHLRAGLFRTAEQRTHDRVGSPTWSVGVIKGGVSVNIVPDSCSIDIDYRSLPGETAESVLAEVDEALDELRTVTAGIEIEREAPFLVSWPLDTPSSSAVVQAALRAQQTISGTRPLTGVPYGSDASLLAVVGGIPSVVVGPGDISVAHGPDEYVDLKELEEAADLYEAIALAFDPSDTGAMEAIT